MTTISRRWLLSWGLLLFIGCVDSQGADGVRLDTRALPDGLVEVSGLASGPDDVLLAIGDELGLVYAIRFDRVEVQVFSTLGDPPLEQDFEGLAVLGDHLYALDSEGRLYRQGLASDSQLSRIKTGLKKHCEFEGLAADPERPWLWLLCKTTKKKRLEDKLTIYVWDTRDNRLLEGETVSTPYAELGFARSLNPSALDFTPEGHLLVLAARQHAYVVVDRAGQRVRHGRLSKAHHPQAEGVLVRGETIYVADEGAGGVARLSRYPNGF